MASREISISIALTSLTCLFVSLFSPLLGLWLVTVTLVLTKQTNISLQAAIFISSMTMAAIVTSRAIGVEADDFVVYYNIYKVVTEENNVLIGAMLLGNPLEVVLPSLFFLIGLVSPNLTEHQLLSVVAFAISFLALQVFLYALSGSDNYDKAIVLALSCSFISLTLFDQLIRQALASVFVFLALYKKGRGQIGLVFFAVLLHTSSLFIYILMYFFKHSSTKNILLVLLFIVIIIAVPFDLFEFNILSTFDFRYLRQLSATEGFSGVDIGNLKVFLLGVSAMFYVTSIDPRLRSDKELSENIRIVVGMLVLFLVFLPIQLISSRITLIVSMLSLGYFVGISLIKLNRELTTSLFVVAFSFLKPIMLIPWNPDVIGFYWVNYPWIDYVPGYYFLASFKLVIL